MTFNKYLSIEKKKENKSALSNIIIRKTLNDIE